MRSYVMTPYTSLLVLETEADYERFHVDRGRKDHWAMYPLPERIPVVYEHARGQQAPAEKQDKTDAQTVLSTIVMRLPPPLITTANYPAGNPPPALAVSEIYGGAYAAPVDPLTWDAATTSGTLSFLADPVRNALIVIGPAG